jgi:hypothetical protein
MPNRIVQASASPAGRKRQQRKATALDPAASKRPLYRSLVHPLTQDPKHG